MRNAYGALHPDSDMLATKNLDALLPGARRDKFYKDLAKGLAKPEDFERYVYGGNYGRKFYTDDRDKMEDSAMDTISKWEEETKDEVERAKMEAALNSYRNR